MKHLLKAAYNRRLKQQFVGDLGDFVKGFSEISGKTLDGARVFFVPEETVAERRMDWLYEADGYENAYDLPQGQLPFNNMIGVFPREGRFYEVIHYQDLNEESIFLRVI